MDKMTMPNNSFWQEFLEEYKSLPVLWKVNSTDYSNRDKRNKSWKILLSKYREKHPDATVDQLKNKINSIRTCYRRELKKVISSERSGRGEDEVYTPSLWYYDCLHFLKDQKTSAEGASFVEIVDDLKDIDKQQQQKSKKPRGVAAGNKLLEEKKQFYRHAEYISDSASKKDEADVFAEGWACLFRKLSEEQRLFAKKVIDEALLYGQLKKLTIKSGISSLSSSVNSSGCSTLYFATSSPEVLSPTP